MAKSTRALTFGYQFGWTSEHPRCDCPTIRFPAAVTSGVITALGLPLVERSLWSMVDSADDYEVALTDR
jgi:hypothetical protein